MSVFSGAFSYLQKIGKCMMLPVSVLPVAGILLGVGSANLRAACPGPGRLEGLVKMSGHTYVLRECKRRKITTETFLGEGRLLAPLPIR